MDAKVVIQFMRTGKVTELHVKVCIRDWGFNWRCCSLACLCVCVYVCILYMYVLALRMYHLKNEHCTRNRCWEASLFKHSNYLSQTNSIISISDSSALISYFVLGLLILKPTSLSFGVVFPFHSNLIRRNHCTEAEVVMQNIYSTTGEIPYTYETSSRSAIMFHYV